MYLLLSNSMKRSGLGAINNTGRITLGAQFQNHSVKRQLITQHIVSSNVFKRGNLQIEPVWGHGGMIRYLSTKIIPPKPVSTGQVDNVNNDLDDVRNELKKVRSDADSIRDEIKQAQGKIKVLTDEWEREGDTFSKKDLLASRKEDLATLITREATLISERKELEAKLPQSQPPPPITPFHDAFEKVINKGTWPKSLNAFLPKPFKPPPHSPYAVSAKKAKVMASFRDKTPELLLTLLDEDINFSHLTPLDVDEELKLMPSAPNLSLENLWKYGIILIIGPPGTGKTRLTLQIGWRKFVAFFVCDRRGNGGSEDVKDILEYATTNIGGDGVDAIARHINNKIKQGYRFRAKLLEYCMKRYGVKNFQPRHWTMLQMYSNEIVGVDLFKEFGEYNVVEFPSIIDKIEYIVLDEGQIADRMLPETFPSLKEKGKFRSLLSPIMRALDFANQRSPTILCGTGLSSSSSSEIARSTKDGTKPGTFGMSTFLDGSSVVTWLERWGVNDASSHKEECEDLVGRPRPVTFLAKYLLSNGDWDAALKNSLKEATTVMRVECKNLKGQRVLAPHAMANENSIDMLFFMQMMAQRYRAGRRAIVDQGTIYAIEYGFAGFDAHDMRIAIREPIVVTALLTDGKGKEIAMDDEFEVFLPDDDGVAGTMFQDYMVRHGKQVAEFVSSQAKSLEGERGLFVGFGMREPISMGRRLAMLARAGEEATMLEAMLSGKIKTPMMKTDNDFGPDLVRVFWKGGKPMVVFEQHRSGGDSFPEAFKTLEHLHCTNRGKPNMKCEQPQVVQDLKACIMKYKAVVVYLVVKPMSKPSPAAESPKYPSIVADPQFDGKNVLKVVISSTNVPTWMNKAETMLKMLKGRLPLNLPEGPP